MRLSDFYVDNVMSGGFRPPSDPEGSEYTLAQLSAAIVEEGDPKPHLSLSTEPGIQVDYEVDLGWAPVHAKASTETLNPSGPKNLPYFVELSPVVKGEAMHTFFNNPFMFISIERLSEVAFITLAIVAEKDNWLMHSSRTRLDSVTDSARGKVFVARVAETYFNQFEGWTKNGDVWLPPTPDAGRQVAGSAG